MAGERVFIDSNILIYTSDQLSPFHEKAKSKLEDLEMQQDQVWISRQVIREYLVVVSRLMILNQRYDPKQLIEMVQMFHQVFRIADENESVTNNLTFLIQKYSVSGKIIHDCNIVATMKACAVGKLLTNNVSDFSRFKNEIDIIGLI